MYTLEQFNNALGVKNKMARCPAHDDTHASMSVNEVNGVVAVHCHACNDPKKVFDACLAKVRAMYPEQRTEQESTAYEYQDDEGKPLVRTTKYQNGGKKFFKQEHFNNGSWQIGAAGKEPAPYRFHEWKDAKTVVLVEGEKCADALWAVGIPATTTIGGAQSWKARYAKYFEGKIVPISPDNDEPGKRYANNAFADLIPVSLQCFIFELPVGEGEDVYDYLQDHTAEDFKNFVSSNRKSVIESVGFTESAKWVENLDGILQARNESLIPFGVRCLDEPLHGIMKNDLVVLAAKSGNGKTQLAMHIAKNAIQNGKRVAFFALEAFQGEIQQRMVYSIASTNYYAEKPMGGPFATYGDWIKGEPNVRKALKPFIEDAIAEVTKNTNGFYTYYKQRAERFGIEDFKAKFAAVKNEVDLVIMDHLGFFDMADEKSDNRGTTEIMKQTRECVNQHDIPCVMISHVRKENTYDKKLLPDIEDIHGTSDVYKIATKVIITGKSQDTVSGNQHLRPTYMRISKDRFGDSVESYIMQVQYDIREARFQQEYDIGLSRMDKNKPSWSSLSDLEIKYPHWHNRLFKKPIIHPEIY